jgi:hypothetical protein
MRRALFLLAALAIPALVRAQTTTTGTVTFAPDAFIGAAACDPAANDTVEVTWVVPVSSVIGGTYRVFASTRTPRIDDSTGLRLCDENPVPADGVLAGQVGSDISATSGTQTEELRTNEFLARTSPADFTCDPTQTRTIHVCIHFFALDQSIASASAFGALTLDLKAPSKPVITRIDAGEEALRVSWNEGADGAADATYFRIQAQASDPAQDPDTHTARITDQSGDDESGRIAGLKNGVAYQVTVTAFSAADNASEPSDPATGTPIPVQDFWEHYDASGGQEQGGCATGPGGALGILGAALALALHRRRK